MRVEKVIADYCDGVLAGDVPACQHVRRAVQRHLADLKNGRKRGLHFDAEAAQLWCDFIGLLPHVKGELAGQPIRLEPWQVFVIGSIFGWKRSDGLRRFSTAYVEIPRKNAKTTLAAGIGLGGVLIDGEEGAEVYAAATKRDQAKICWGIARQMVKKSPWLAKRLRIHDTGARIYDETAGSIFQPLGKDADTLDGLNPSMVVIDEFHAHKTPEMYDVIETGEGARRQPLKVVITTAGFNQDGPCYKVHKDCIGILAGEHDDDSIFAYIAGLDSDDDWQDESSARKANPNFGVSVKPEWLAGMVAKSIRIPSRQPAVKTKLFDLWVSSATCWMPSERWDACDLHVDPDALIGRECWGGLDLASVSDIGSLVLAFPMDGDRLDVLHFAWVPRNRAVERSHDDKVPYLAWADDFGRTGLTLTDGDRTGYATIENDILALGSRYRIRLIAADRWNLEFLRQRLEGAGVEIVEFGQGYQSMSPAIRQLERLILGRELAHGGNPVLRWAVGNVVSETDPQNNIRFSKKKSTEKIDPAVALVMATAMATLQSEGAGTGPSVYEGRGILTI